MLPGLKKFFNSSKIYSLLVPGIKNDYSRRVFVYISKYKTEYVFFSNFKTNYLKTNYPKLKKCN